MLYSGISLSSNVWINRGDLEHFSPSFVVQFSIEPECCYEPDRLLLNRSRNSVHTQEWWDLLLRAPFGPHEVSWLKGVLISEVLNREVPLCTASIRIPSLLPETSRQPHFPWLLSFLFKLATLAATWYKHPLTTVMTTYVHTATTYIRGKWHRGHTLRTFTTLYGTGRELVGLMYM